MSVKRTENRRGKNERNIGCVSCVSVVFPFITVRGAIFFYIVSVLQLKAERGYEKNRSEDRAERGLFVHCTVERL